MAYSALAQRISTCPNCLSDNVLIGSTLSPNTELSCSQCGAHIGPWSDTRDRYVEYEPRSHRDLLVMSQTSCRCSMPLKLLLKSV